MTNPGTQLRVVMGCLVIYILFLATRFVADGDKATAIGVAVIAGVIAWWAWSFLALGRERGWWS